VVLHAHDPADGVRLGEHLGRHVADADVFDQALRLQLDQRFEGLGE